MNSNLKKLESILINTRNVQTFLNTLEIYLKISNSNNTDNTFKPCIFKEYIPSIAYKDFTNHCEYIESKINDISYFDVQDLNKIKAMYTLKGEEIKRNDR